MGYFQTGRDLALMREFESLVKQLWAREDKVEFGPGYQASSPGELQSMICHVAADEPEYTACRNHLARIVDEVSRAASRHGVDPVMLDCATGQPVLHVDVFQSVLHDMSRIGIERRFVTERIHRTIGQCVRDRKREFWDLFNPAFWIASLIVYIVVLPVKIASCAGANVGEAEKRIASKAFLDIVKYIVTFAVLVWVLGFPVRRAILHLLSK